MDNRKAIIILQYAERIKSELIIASGLLENIAALDGPERLGAEKMMKAYLDAVAGEIRIAQHHEKSMNFIGAERKVLEATGKMEALGRNETHRCISEALSLITTSSQRAMEYLVAQKLL